MQDIASQSEMLNVEKIRIQCVCLKLEVSVTQYSKDIFFLQSRTLGQGKESLGLTDFAEDVGY